MTTQTKNTTAVERRIERRQILADTLTKLAGLIEQVLKADGTILRDAATELLIGNTEILLAQQWATDKVDRQALDVFQRAIDAKPGEPAGVTVKIGELPLPWQRDTRVTLQTGTDGRLEPAAKPQGGRLVRWLVVLPGGSNAWCSCPEHAEEYKKSQPGSRIVKMVEATVDGAMIDRAADGWEQYTGGFTGAHNRAFRREAMTFALQQALKVRA